jgi:hypothetical protein
MIQWVDGKLISSSISSSVPGSSLLSTVIDTYHSNHKD